MQKTGDYDEAEGGSWLRQVLQEGQESSLQIPSWVFLLSFFFFYEILVNDLIRFWEEMDWVW